MDTKQYVREIAGQGYLNYIRVLVDDGLTPHQVGNRVHKALLGQYGWSAPLPFVQAVDEVARDMMRKEGK